ncbi:hypothetical protein C0033_01885 [Clostridium sp. chh4-2]|nr:hypothetical protein C0033_01885 [Clostridium sp. chh4-2]
MAAQRSSRKTGRISLFNSSFFTLVLVGVLFIGVIFPSFILPISIRNTEPIIKRDFPAEGGTADKFDYWLIL